MILREITGIMACDQHHVISYKGALPWNCPADIAFYTKMIENQIVVMGYKTFLQMSVSFLENHTTVVFSKTAFDETNPLVTIVSSLDEFFNLKCLPKNKQCYMIGGAEIATLFLENKAIANFYLTEIEGYYPGDVFFPMDLMKNYPRKVHLTGPGFTIYYYRNLRDKNDENIFSNQLI